MNFAPINGLILGIALILFRDKACKYLQKTYEHFPQNKDAVESLNIKFKIRPTFIAILGLIVSLFSLFALIR